MFLKNHSHRIRLGEGSEGDMSLLLVISAIWASNVSRLSAANSPDHPYVEIKDLKPETCPNCLSYSDPDASQTAHLRPGAAVSGGIANNLSHGGYCNFIGVNAGPQNIATLQGSLSGGQL